LSISFTTHAGLIQFNQGPMGHETETRKQLY
jgi:hypothetical protein